ncbi:Panacea domain-containing protein [Patescibacteria group bacterium]
MSKINTGKYKNAVLYFSANCNNSHLGRVKLNKLFYYLDFISYRDRGKSVTGDVYIHEDFGPVPQKIEEIVSKLKKDSELVVEFDPEYKTAGKYFFKNKKSPKLKSFDAYEKDLLKKICKFFFTWSTSKIITQTHLEAPWFYSEIFDVVDYKYAKDIDFFLLAD